MLRKSVTALFLFFSERLEEFHALGFSSNGNVHQSLKPQDLRSLFSTDDVMDLLHEFFITQLRSSPLVQNEVDLCREMSIFEGKSFIPHLKSNFLIASADLKHRFFVEDVVDLSNLGRFHFVEVPVEELFEFGDQQSLDVVQFAFPLADGVQVYAFDQNLNERSALGELGPGEGQAVQRD